MSFNRELLIDRIKELSQAKSISATKALQESGAGKDFIANLKKGQAPSIEKIAIVADYFNVSVDYLLGKEETSDISIQTAYNAAPEEIKAAIRKLLDV